MVELPVRVARPKNSLPKDDPGSRPLAYTLSITNRCNLACAYCYVVKSPTTMTLDMARQAVDFIFHHAPPKRIMDIGFFGGEPLLEFPLVRAITEIIQNHPAYDPGRVLLSMTTNGTVYNDEIASFLIKHAIKVCVSCDGPAHVQNLFRRTAAGLDTSALVERNLVSMLKTLPAVTVNAVYHPKTLGCLPEVAAYFSSLGLRQIYQNPDFTARWTRQDVEQLTGVYRALGERYIAWYLEGDPHYLSLIDTKIAVLLRGGYRPSERCQMGTGELAITPDGGLYPCGRLVGSGASEEYRIGTIQSGVQLSRLLARCAPGGEHNPECQGCSLKDYCMNWCGCSNAFMTGYLNRVGPFLCTSERALIMTALEIYDTLERQLGPMFLHHMSGEPLVNSGMERKGQTTGKDFSLPPDKVGRERMR